MAAVASANAVGASVGVLAAANLLNNRWLPKAYVPTSVATTAVLLITARRRGLTWRELGLSRDALRRGLVTAAGSAAGVGSVYALAAVVPATRPVFADQRAPDSLGGAAWQALVPVFFGTVLLEEIGFRGVLWGLVNRRGGAGAATAVSSVLFGLWHILPSRELARHNRAFGRAVAGRSRPAAAAVVSAVAGSAAAGVVLCELRRRTGSLLAPAGTHWATNGLGYLVAAEVRRRSGIR